jgi:hypothetical protein
MIPYLLSVKKRRPSCAQGKRSTGSTLHIECLEARYVFAGAPPVILENWQSAIFNDGVSGTLQFELSRSVPTVEPNGDLVAAGQPRFGDERLLTEIGSWSEVLSNVGNASIFGSGRDHDGQTPLVILWEQDQRRLTFIRGTDFAIVNTIVLPGNFDLFRGEITGFRYIPQHAVIHEGLVVVMLQRDRRVGANWVTDGISFAYTQDHGQTFQRIEQVGGGYDVPGIAGGVADGLDRAREWSFTNAFPEKSVDDTLGAWFPWADYLQKSGNPKGGQIGLFRARREAVGEPWVVEPNRLVYEVWEPQDSGGFHAHTAGMFVDGMASFWGDVSYRNRIVRHVAEDLENYTTTTWTHQEDFQGAWSPANAPVHSIGNQALSAAPGPNFGEILVSGDEQVELIMKVERPENYGDKAIITNLHGMFSGINTGISFAGRMAPMLKYLRGVGYVLTEQSTLVPGANALFFSPDGVTWSQLLNKGGATYFYGNQMIVTTSGSLHALAIPKQTSVAAPLLLNPGGQNLATTDPLQVVASAAGNQARRVLYIDGLYIYQDTLEPLDVQPPGPPPVMDGMPIWEFTTAGLTGNMGAWELGDIASVFNQLHWLSAWHYSLDGDGISPAIRIGDIPNSERQSVWVANNHWVPTLNFGVPDPNSTAIDEQRIRILNGTNLAPRRWLSAIQGYNQGAAPTYPLAPGVNGPHELAAVRVFDVTASWSTALTFGLPDLSSFSTHFDPAGVGTVHTIASIYQSNNEHIDVTFTRTATAQGVFSIDVYSSNILMDRLSFSEIYFDREDQIRLVLSNSPEELGVTLLVTRNGYGMDSKSIVGGGTSLVPSQIRLSNATRTVVEPMEWFAVQFSPTQALTTAQREIMIGLSYMFDRLDAPPVIGPPGFDDDDDIDGRDFLIWQRGYGITEWAMREDGDANQDGRVDELDLAIWQKGYGLGGVVGPPSADFNQDGYVDGSDLATWQVGYGIQRTGNAHSQGDANRNGDVDGRDFLIWQRQYTGPAPEQVVAPELQTSDISDSSSLSVLEFVESILSGGQSTGSQSSISAEDTLVSASTEPTFDLANRLLIDEFWLPVMPLYDLNSKHYLHAELVVDESAILDEELMLEATVFDQDETNTKPYRAAEEFRYSTKHDWLLDFDLAIEDWQAY